jgi:hypothetical protein
VTRLVDRLLSRAGYWEGMASGAAVLTQSYGSPDREAILPSLTAWAQQANGSSAVVFSAILARIALFSEARMQLQALDDRHLFGNQSLAVLEHPWPDGTTGELLARNEQDVSLAGQSYTWAPPGEDRLVRLRPDWTTIVSEVVRVDGGGWYRSKVGYWVQPPRGITGQGDGEFYPAGEVAHWAPIPDPQADFRGMSWLTPVYRDIAGDDGLTQYKIKYLENSASPNLLIKYAQKLHSSTIDGVRERMHARYAGVGNAFKTLVLDQGADVTIIGNSLAQMDFSNVAAAGEQRILAASNVPGVLIGLEPLRGAGRGYQESMQKFGNLYARPQWRSWCAAHAKLVSPPAGSRLWYDTTDIAALQDAAMERGQTALVNMQAALTGRQAGFTRESIVIAVNSGDVTKLVPDPKMPPPGAGAVQHMLGQAQPGATATALPASSASLPVGSTSPGDGGNGTRPAPQPSAARRAITSGQDGTDDEGEPQECPACGAMCGPDDLFCGQCGAQLPDGGEPEDDEDDAGMARFDPSESRVTGGAGGGRWTAGGGGAAKAAPAAKPAASHAGTGTATANGSGHAAQKEQLHQRAAADREEARQLEKELTVLEHQRKLQAAAHAKAVKTAASTKAGTVRHRAVHRKAARHKKRAASLATRITSLRTRISGLQDQARELDKKAAAL